MNVVTSAELYKDDRGCISLGSLTMKYQDRTLRFPNIGLIKQSNTHTGLHVVSTFVLCPRHYAN